jgi:hypothetical protein
MTDRTQPVPEPSTSESFHLTAFAVDSESYVPADGQAWGSDPNLPEVYLRECQLQVTLWDLIHTTEDCDECLDSDTLNEAYKSTVETPHEGNGPLDSLLLPGMLLLASVLSQFAILAFGAIGPVATVHIANQNISPDGFSRS